MINQKDKLKIIEEFTEFILNEEKNNLKQLQPKASAIMVEKLKSGFEEVVSKYENKIDNDK